MSAEVRLELVKRNNACYSMSADVRLELVTSNNACYSCLQMSD